MAVDQNAVAWVNYNDGNLFKVDTSTGKCEATGFVPDQHGLKALGMGFVFDPTTGHDTLYVAGNGNNSPSTQSTLATIAFPSLTLAPIGPLTAGIPEITGTGDGQLWGFVPAAASSNGESTLVSIDPATGKSLESYSYLSLTSSSLSGTDWAVKFWGGLFWISSMVRSTRPRATIPLPSRPFSATLAGTSWAPESPPVRPCSRREQVACRRVQPSSLRGYSRVFRTQLRPAEYHRGFCRRMCTCARSEFYDSPGHASTDKATSLTGFSAGPIMLRISPTGHLHRSPSCWLEELVR